MAFQSMFLLLSALLVSSTSATYLHWNVPFGIESYPGRPPFLLEAPIVPSQIYDENGYGSCDYRNETGEWQQLNEDTFYDVGENTTVAGFRIHNNPASEVVYVFNKTLAWVELTANTSVYKRAVDHGTHNGTWHSPVLVQNQAYAHGEYFNNISSVGNYTAPSHDAPWYEKLGQFHMVLPDYALWAGQGVCNETVNIAQNYTDADGKALKPRINFDQDAVIPHDSKFPVTWIAWDVNRTDTWMKIVMPDHSPLQVAYAGNGSYSSASFEPRYYANIAIEWCKYNA